MLPLTETQHESPPGDEAKQGQCLSCGQQLFLFKPVEGFARRRNTANTAGKPLIRIPLTVPTLVKNGQCLKCKTRSEPEEVALEDDCVAGISNKDTLTRLNDEDEEEEGEKLSNSLDVTYSGSYNENGEKHGKGILQWKNGRTYEGWFEHGQPSGRGTMTFGSRNDEYTGDWLEGMMHGKGTRRYPSGDAYIGEYVKGKRQGEGRIHYASGDLYWGNFEDNQPHGKGRYYYSTGQRFEGDFLHGRRYGKGKFQRADGCIEIFQYINDVRVGEGVRWSKDRTQAWRVWKPQNNEMIGLQSERTNLEKESLTIPEAVAMAFEIEKIAAGKLLEAVMEESMSQD